MIETQCPKCANRFLVPEAALGKKGRCDKCQEVFELRPGAAKKSPATALIAIAGLLLILAGARWATSGPADGVIDPALQPVKTPDGPTKIDSTAPDTQVETIKNSGTGSGSKTDPKTKKGPGEEKAQQDTSRDDEELASWAESPPADLSRASNLGLGSSRLSAGQAVLFNGRRLGLEVPAGGHLAFLPCGQHRLQQGAGSILLVVTSSYAERYDKERARLTLSTVLDYEAVVRQMLAELCCPEEPIIGHLLGLAYMERRAWPAAARAFRRNIQRHPGFALSHLNLALCLYEMGEKDESFRELRLAEDFDGFGAWGLECGFASLRDRLNRSDYPKLSFDPKKYQDLIPSDDPLVNTQRLYIQFARGPADAAAALNNAGLQLLRTKRYEPARACFFEALNRLAAVKPTRLGRRVVSTIYANLARLYTEAQWSEAAEVELMQGLFPR